MNRPDLKAPLPAVFCPLCSGQNNCQVAASGTFDTPCWCKSESFSSELLDRVPAAQRGLACICQSCAAAKVPDTSGSR